MAEPEPEMYLLKAERYGGRIDLWITKARYEFLVAHGYIKEEENNGHTK